ncbi:hypothetical protein [Vibrio caribbeanicus]|uniref:hypothetical protein n=1 Tax=Vibrio caribbeanicus TaxID=701175 RepID=UPI0030DCB8D3
MKLKNIAFVYSAAFALTACNTVKIDELQPTANPQVISSAKEALSGCGDTRVTDNGVIYILKKLPGGHRWLTQHVVEGSYRISCQNMREFVDAGMIVRVSYRGKGGTTQDYDKARCETEIPTDIYKNW